MKQTLGITVGDLWGIGPEILLKAFQEMEHKQTPQHSYRVYCDLELFGSICQQQNLKDLFLSCKNLPFVIWDEGVSEKMCAQNDEAMRAKIAKDSLDHAIKDAKQNKLKGMVTCPLDKKIMRHAISDFQGHTEYLQDQVGVKKTWMMLDNGEIRVVLLTNHLVLKDVPQAITQSKIKQAIEDIHVYFVKHKQGKPKIAVCALNPHCGELSDSSEEKLIIQPSVQALQAQGYAVEGPFSADALFSRARQGQWDAVLAMYHDQGLVAAKYPGSQNAINITLGLPFTRTSPAHGVAYDIVGKNQASHQSMLKALLF